MLCRSLAAAALLLASIPARADGIPPLSEDRVEQMTCYTLPMAPDRKTFRLSQGTSLFDIRAELFTVTAEAVTAETWQVSKEDHTGSGPGDLILVYTAPGFELLERIGLEIEPGQAFHLTAGATDAYLDCGIFGGIIH